MGNPLLERYSDGAEEYARYWAPVLEETASRLIDEVDAHFKTDFLRRSPSATAAHSPTASAFPRSRSSPLRPLTLLDVGAGTGTLAMAAARRWPHAQIIVSDGAAGMVDLARGRADEAGLVGGDRMSFVVGPAEELPLASGSVDVAVSSFVLQLVPDRLAALTEIRRVLRPSGLLVYVTWLDREAREPFRAADEFDEAVYDLNVEEPEESDEPVAGDLKSARAAADELRRAGFVRASARDETLVYQWSMESYLDYKLGYDERALIGGLSAEQAGDLERGARTRLARLTPDDFRWHAPVVFARGFAPSG